MKARLAPVKPVSTQRFYSAASMYRTRPQDLHFVALADRIDVIGFKSVARQLVFIGNRSDLVGC